MLQRIYLDTNAGAPLLKEAREAMLAALDGSANPSSVHAEGRAAHATLEAARAEVADSVGAEPRNVVFTSGATEAAALALSPKVRAGNSPANRLYVVATEHPCVLHGGRFAADAVTVLPVGRSGKIDLAALEAALDLQDPADGVPYLALMLANNETGVVHPVAEATRIVKRHGGIVFCDAAQAPGRIPVDIQALGVDFLALSAHKLGGPQGAGALVLLSEDVRPEPILAGGVAALRGLGYEVEELQTQQAGDASRLAREAVAAGFDVVVAVGGDGTVNETINGLAGSDTPLAIVPTGTVNVLAMELGIPLEPPDAVQLLGSDAGHICESTSGWPATGTSGSWPEWAWTPPWSPPSTRR